MLVIAGGEHGALSSALSSELNSVPNGLRSAEGKAVGTLY